MTIKFDTETIRIMTLFENLTGVTVRDCLIDENMVYLVVDEEKIGMAIGKNGNSVKNAEKVINKTIKLFAFSDNLDKFVKNLIQKANSVKINNENGKIVIEVGVEKNDRPMVIGREGKNLKILKELLRRSHNVSDLIIR
ncbi:MAG: NusA-like transcription termination signal-binding factor [Candidatus Aenigmatarchaeota archaeon]